MAYRRLLLSVAGLISCLSVGAAQPPQQNPPGAVQPAMLAPPTATAVAATVNGQPIPELAVYRAVGKRADQSKQIRDEVLNYLIDNVLVDMYLDQMKVEIDPKDLDLQVQKVKAEISQSGKKLEQVMSELFLTEAELRNQVNATLRWEKFISQYASEKTLREYFETNKAIFDGSSIRVKHILLTVPAGNGAAIEQAKAKLAHLRKQLESQVAQGLAAAGKLDNLEAQKLRMQLTSDRFAALATAESSCQTKSAGGELGWFPRSGGGRVPESFAKAAFTLKPWELSDAVVTECGVHLILCVDSKAGTQQRFEDIREVVRDFYSDKMREGIAALMRQGGPNHEAAKIVLNPSPK